MGNKTFDPTDIIEHLAQISSEQSLHSLLRTQRRIRRRRTDGLATAQLPRIRMGEKVAGVPRCNCRRSRNRVSRSMNDQHCQEPFFDYLKPRTAGDEDGQ
ncbi:hypothetical protein M378DRAFT_155192 [Amanita muscaria Koide BX008]|uniref:Uncharacterized protein n=1 Tax=Amanita muscaria (strain Koide BX008) TaxID=946122 RepID=A0A0C2XQW4_AMAMK|nr:hypothetical protein M378DRAFT_155192 [Amanita muscaria Koide BX008]